MSAVAPSPFMQVLSGFAQARHRLDRWTEKEIHLVADRPVGAGWYRISTTDIETVWGRDHVTRVPL